MIDAELVRRKLSLVLPDLQALQRYAEMDIGEYLSDPLHELVVERYIERIVGRIIDVNFHVITELGEPPPRDYFTSFVTMGTLGVLDMELARALAPAAGLRNRIAHEYDAIEPKLVHGALTPVLSRLAAYVAAIDRFMERSG